MRRIGILGGTFDPVHNAHLALAAAALEQYQMECILFVPTGRPVRKLETIQASAEDRLRMLELACEGASRLCVSTVETQREGISYTADTLYELKELYGADTVLYLILGEDTATDLGTWKDSQKIAQLARVLYTRRPPAAGPLALPDGFECYELIMDAYDLSSTQVRNCLALGEDVSAIIPPKVYDYIKRHDLYAKL